MYVNIDREWAKWIYVSSPASLSYVLFSVPSLLLPASSFSSWPFPLPLLPLLHTTHCHHNHQCLEESLNRGRIHSLWAPHPCWVTRWLTPPPLCSQDSTKYRLFRNNHHKCCNKRHKQAELMTHWLWLLKQWKRSIISFQILQLSPLQPLLTRSHLVLECEKWWPRFVHRCCFSFGDILGHLVRKTACFPLNFEKHEMVSLLRTRKRKTTEGLGRPSAKYFYF